MDGPIRIQQCLSGPSEGWDQGLPPSEKGYAQRRPPISLPSELTVCLLADKAALMLTHAAGRPPTWLFSSAA